MIRLNVFMTVSERHHSEILMIARQLTEASLQEPGCKGYDFFQSVTRPHTMMICETWENQAALETHRQTPPLPETRPPAPHPLRIHSRNLRKITTATDTQPPVPQPLHSHRHPPPPKKDTKKHKNNRPKFGQFKKYP